MGITVIVRDETALGKSTHELALEVLTERVSVRELIRSRVYQEVTEHNAKQAGPFRGLVQPREGTAVAGGADPLVRRRVDWREQYELALAGFGANRFLILVGDRQVTDLDEEVELRHDTAVTFFKLVPLIGG